MLSARKSQPERKLQCPPGVEARRPRVCHGHSLGVPLPRRAESGHSVLEEREVAQTGSARPPTSGQPYSVSRHSNPRNARSWQRPRTAHPTPPGLLVGRPQLLDIVDPASEIVLQLHGGNFNFRYHHTCLRDLWHRACGTAGQYLDLLPLGRIHKQLLKERAVVIVWLDGLNLRSGRRRLDGVSVIRAQAPTISLVFFPR